MRYLSLMRLPRLRSPYLSVFFVQKLSLALMAGFLGLSLTACGRRGTPEPPPGVNSDRTPSYLNEVTSGRLDSHNAVDKDLDPSASAAAKPAKQPRTFLLDPML
jgi:hypothetical protein